MTFIIRERSGGASSGYISSGFFGGEHPHKLFPSSFNSTHSGNWLLGLTVGRILLLWLNKKIGERTALLLYAVVCIGYVSDCIPSSPTQKELSTHHCDFSATTHSCTCHAPRTPTATTTQPRTHRLVRPQPHRKRRCHLLRRCPHGPNVPHPRQPNQECHSASAPYGFNRLDCGSGAVRECDRAVCDRGVVCEVWD